MDFSEKIRQSLYSILSSKEEVNASILNNALRLLSKWRSVLIQNTLVQNHGCTVLDGPLKGLHFLEESSEGCHIAKLLGTYEQPLHHAIEEALQKNYQKIINIGSAEGYYAVGLAKRNPMVMVEAYDIDQAAQIACLNLAEKNGVRDRVAVGGEFSAEMFDMSKGTRCLVFCDVEGAEAELLDLSRSSALSTFDLIVESHECIVPGMTDRLITSFSETHDIKRIDDYGLRSCDRLPEWFGKLAHLDQLLATWEWRDGPTPWLVMNSKSLVGGTSSASQ